MDASIKYSAISVSHLVNVLKEIQCLCILICKLIRPRQKFVCIRYSNQYIFEHGSSYRYS